MPTYWTSFKIGDATVRGSTAASRHQAVEQAIDDISTECWKETICFAIFRSELSLKAIATKLKSAIDRQHDVFVIRTMEAPYAIVCGKNPKTALLGLIKYVEVR